MIQLHAQPYDLYASGFYFTSAEEYAAKAKANRNKFGEPVEEYEIQFIDGDALDCELSKAWGLYQSSFAKYLEAAEDWSADEKLRYIIAVGECGYAHTDTPGELDVTLYEERSYAKLAEQFVEDGLFGEVPDRFANYIDYEAIGRDLAIDYAQTIIAGAHYIYRCA